MIYKLPGIVFALLLSLPLASETVGELFEDTVLITLSQDEMTSLKQFVGDSLSTSKDGEKMVWRSEESQTVGVVKSAVSFDYQEKNCRRAWIGLKNRAGKKDFWRFDFCQEGEKWVYTPTPLVNLSSKDRASLTQTIHYMLDHGAPKKPISWHSKRRTMFASMVLLSDVGECREVAVSLMDKAASEVSGVYEFCLVDNEWKYTGKD